MKPAPFPVLYAIVDVDACGRASRDPIEIARAYLAGGARVLQLRAKTLASGAFLDLARVLVGLGREVDATVIINDRADIALMAAASGVHVGQDDLPPADARRILGPASLVGVSTHTIEQVESALTEPIDYLAVGPVFATGTKDTGYEPVGLDLVARAAALARPRGIEVVAIGGITRASAASVVAAGAAALAVIGELMRADAAQAVRDFCRDLDGR